MSARARAAGVLAALLVFPTGACGGALSGSPGAGASGSYAVTLDAPTGAPAEITVRRHDGAPLRLDSVTVEPAMPQMGHALAPVVAQRTGPDRFATRGPLLTMPGPWEVLVLLGEGADTESVIVQVE